jgi:tRNA(adenine34) deaminase
MTDIDYMKEALRLAEEAAGDAEVPVGAVVVRDGVIIGRGRNRREKDKNALAHAELEAIAAACQAVDGWRLWDCDLFVTLEPCPMCAGAIVNARIRRVVFGAFDPKAGAAGSVFDLFALPLNHKPQVQGGLLEGDCAAILQEFFRELRNGSMQN